MEGDMPYGIQFLFSNLLSDTFHFIIEERPVFHIFYGSSAYTNG